MPRNIRTLSTPRLRLLRERLMTSMERTCNEAKLDPEYQRLLARAEARRREIDRGNSGKVERLALQIRFVENVLGDREPRKLQWKNRKPAKVTGRRKTSVRPRTARAGN